MKRKALREFAAWFEANQRRYVQVHPCKCIASHALTWAKEREKTEPHGFVEDLVRIFDLPWGEACTLYYHDKNSGTPTRATAVTVIKRLARTGNVDWNLKEKAAR